MLLLEGIDILVQIIINMSIIPILGGRVHQAEEQKLSQGNANKTEELSQAY